MLALFTLLITAQIFLFFFFHFGAQNIEFHSLLTSLDLTAPIYWPVFVFFVRFFCCFFQYLIPVCWPLPWTPPLPLLPLPLSFAMLLLWEAAGTWRCEERAVGEWCLDCGWPLSVGGGLRVRETWHVSPREVFGLCMMTVSHPVLSFLCMNFFSFNL